MKRTNKVWKWRSAKGNRSLAGALGLLLALSLTLALALPILAVPLPDHAFRGQAYVANAPGNPAVPEGTKITCEINGVEYAETFTDATGYYGAGWTFNVPGDDPGSPPKTGGVNGDIIDFYVHGSKIWVADWVFNSGDHTTLNLPVNDPDPPAVTINPLDPDPTANPTPTFTGTAIDTLCSVVLVEYSVNGGDWTAATAVDGDFDEAVEEYTFTITPSLADGPHIVSVRATDAAGNTTAEVDYATDEFTVDTDPPAVTINPLDPDPTANPTPTFTGTAIDTLCSVVLVEYSVNGGDWTAATAVDGDFDEAVEDYTFTITPALADGPHIVSVRATDVAGNTTAEVDYATDEFTVDTGTVPDEDPPVVEDTSPASNALNVAVDAPVWAVFNEDVVAIDLSGVTISGATGVVATLNELTNTLNIAHDNFALGALYTVTIPAGAIEDLSGNPNALYTWSFTTVSDEGVYLIGVGAGWNIISTPITLDASYDTWQEFATLGDGLDWEIAYYYEDGIFKLIQEEPAYPFVPCDAIYVYMNSADTVAVIPKSGITPPPSRMLSSGWNLVGSAFLETAQMPLNQALNSIYYAPGTGGDALPWGYSIVISPGESFNQAGWVYIRDFGTVPDMVVGKGYWVFMVNAGEYAGQTYTPWP